MLFQIVSDLRGQLNELKAPIGLLAKDVKPVATKSRKISKSLAQPPEKACVIRLAKPLEKILIRCAALRRCG